MTKKNNKWIAIGIILLVVIILNQRVKMKKLAGETIVVSGTDPVGFSQTFQLRFTLSSQAGVNLWKIQNVRTPAGWTYTYNKVASGGSGARNYICDESDPNGVGVSCNILANIDQGGIVDNVVILEYTSPSTPQTTAFSGNWEVYAGGALQNSQAFSLSIPVVSPACTTDAECPADTDCIDWSCSAGTCVSSDINEGGSCTGGTCQSGVCVPITCTPDWQCTDWSPTVCPASCEQTRTCTDLNECEEDRLETQACTGGECGVVVCDCNTWVPLECGTGANEGKRRFTRACTPSGCDIEEQYVTDSACAVTDVCGGCEIYQACDETTGECKLAGWVYLVIGFMAFMMFFKMM